MADYWIKGEDGEEYGPATLQELAEWVEENRAGQDTPVRTAPDSPWQPWQNFPELAALLKEARAGVLFPGQPHLTLAPFLQRSLAYIFDLFLLGMVLGIINVLLPVRLRIDSENMYHRMLEAKPLLPDQVWFLLAAMLLYIVYFTFFHGFNGQTPGKKLFHIRVVDAHGLTISYWSALVRAIGSLVSQMPYYAGYLIAFFSPHRRTLHDFIAKTYVVSVPTP